MSKYLVTNIAFNHLSLKGVDQFKIPTDINMIQNWLLDNEYQMSDSEARAAYVRSVLFYNEEMTYDFVEIDGNVKTDDFEVDELFFADLADIRTENMTTMPVTYDIPAAFVVNITTEDMQFAEDNLERAIFLKLLYNLPLDIKVHTISSHICTTIDNCMHQEDANHPDLIAEVVCGLVSERNVSEQKLNEIYDAVHNLTSVLLKDIGKYL